MNKNPYMNIRRIEFTITNACTSRCRHCSAGDSLNQRSSSIDRDAAVTVVRELSKEFDIDSVMTFGGEPLLYPNTVIAIHQAAAESGIPNRQIITNGYFSKDDGKIVSVARALKESGVNSLLLSVDAFHKELIPLERVYLFAKAASDEQISGFKLHPAWVVNRVHENGYNNETEACLAFFNDLHIPVSDGNNIFPSGNAAVYLSSFYEKKPVNLKMKCGEAPYTAKLDNIETIAVNPNGDVVVCGFTIGNILNESITEIVKHYNPYDHVMMKALMDGGVGELIKLAEASGITVDTTEYYSACGVCRELVKKLSAAD
jgi:MoaA/NifB/PqqE/SkfB family radical SAM enzyme